MANKINTNNEIRLEQLDKTVTLITWALLIIVGGLIFALGAILNDSWASKQATYLDLRDKVFEQNLKMDNLNKKLDLVCKTWRKDCPQ